jgi:hypothetical protein
VDTTVQYSGTRVLPITPNSTYSSTILQYSYVLLLGYHNAGTYVVDTEYVFSTRTRYNTYTVQKYS